MSSFRRRIMDIRMTSPFMRFVVCAAGLIAISCGGSSSATAPTAVTKVIAVSGNLAFGTVNLGDSATRSFTISNSGTGPLTFTAITASGTTGSSGLAASPTNGVVQPSGSITVTVQFTPTVAQDYSAVLAITSDSTSGNNSISVSGSGFNNTPLFAQSGVGNSVFVLPATVSTVHITGAFTAFSSNFIVWIGPAGSACGAVINANCRLLVNDLVGTAWGKTVSDGTYQTGGGGTVQITDSDGVRWSMTEVRNTSGMPAATRSFEPPSIEGLTFSSPDQRQQVLSNIATQAAMFEKVAK